MCDNEEILVLPTPDNGLYLELDANNLPPIDSIIPELLKHNIQKKYWQEVAAVYYNRHRCVR